MHFIYSDKPPKITLISVYAYTPEIGFLIIVRAAP